MLIVGRQISSSATEDYAERLRDEMSLIVQGVGPTVDDYLDGRIDDSALEKAFEQYETQVNGELMVIPMDDSGSPGGRDSIHNTLELETATHGQIITVQRKNAQGADTFYTAGPIVYNGRLQALVQLSVPADNLQNLITKRWLELGLIFALMSGAGVIAALWLARSIIRPLYKLRESAARLSTGDFSHRVAYAGKDEIGDVAQAFNEMAQQVESMLEEQRAFASNTSHELRTPLTTIRLRTEALRYDKTLDSADAQRYIAEIDEEVMRLGNLVQDLTLLSRFDAGRAELGQDQVDMVRFAGSIQQQVATPAQDKNLSITLRLPDAPLLVNASLTHLTVVFRNLLDNAIKYTPEGGQITWTLARDDGGIFSTICDTGRGVDAAHLPRLFERFYRVDKARTRDIPGTGLGLALVKSIVEAYGGQISMTSEGVDKGSTVSVFWPQQPVGRKE